jgi:hypothetical protein
MVQPLKFFLLLALSMVSARADLQFSPKLRETKLDGASVKFLVFSDEAGKEISYSPPVGWDYSGNTSKFTLHPSKISQAEATIWKVTLSQPVVFDEATTSKLSAEALASVPEGSTNVNLVSKEKNPLLIGQKETFLVIISYTVFGENYQRSLLFLNRGNEQVRFQFVSRAVDFKQLQGAFQNSLFTWKNL